MCINIIPTAPWSPWRNEEQQPLHRLQCELGRRVVEARTAHVSVQGIEDRGHRSRWPFAWLQRNFHCAIYNININTKGCLELASSAKTSRQSCPGVPLPLPRPPKKKIHNPSKMPPHQISHHPCAARDRSHRQAPIRESSASDPCKGFPPKTSKRQRVDAIKNAHVEPSCHRAGTATGSFQQTPQKERNRDVCPRNGPGLSVYWPQSGG